MNKRFETLVQINENLLMHSDESVNVSMKKDPTILWCDIYTYKHHLNNRTVMENDVMGDSL